MAEKMRAGIIIVLLVAVGIHSCGQNRETETAVADPVIGVNTSSMGTEIDSFVHTEFRYTDSAGLDLTIQNSYPRGGPYTDLYGNRSGYGVFWTHIVNEADTSVEILIDFPTDALRLFPEPESYLKLFLPPGVMSSDKVTLMNYGAMGLKHHLDSGLNQDGKLHRIIAAGDEWYFYTGILFRLPSNGPVRTGLELKGQDLFYRISIANQLDSALIPCGRIVPFD